MHALAAALACAPRRYRMPPLPTDIAGARAAGHDVALAFAIECARTDPTPQARALFLETLAALLTQAADPHTGDPAYRALVMRAGDPEVREYVALQAIAAQDARSVRRLVDAVAHPVRLGTRAGPEAAQLAALYRHAREAEWPALREAAAHLGNALAVHPALQRLVQGDALRETSTIACYRELLAAQGPLAGSNTATENGRAAARVGNAAEAQTVATLREIVQLLDESHGLALQLARSLRVPAGFPGEQARAKDEWDVALLAPYASDVSDASGASGASGAAGASIVLLGEVKASPAAAPADFVRLQRGLLRLSSADAARAYTFAAADGPVTIAGESLRALAPVGDRLPTQVVYFSTAPAGQAPPPLSTASKAVLLAEPACIAFAQGRDMHLLEPVWDALRTQPRLRATLFQHQTARHVAEALLHPQDLLDSLRQLHAPARDCASP